MFYYSEWGRKKTPLFTVEERIELLKHVTRDIENVKIESFSGLLVDFARKKKANCIVKGLRAVSDYEYEVQMALTNKQIAPEIETLFIPTSGLYSYLSSSIVKEVAKYGGDLTQMLPNEIIEVIQNKIGGKE